MVRLVGISTRSAFRHRRLSAKQVGQQIHRHFSGRPYGKLLPRHAGPIAEFLFTHPEARRDELLDFIGHTWNFRVSKVALWEFLKKFGLDRGSLNEIPMTWDRRPIAVSPRIPQAAQRNFDPSRPNLGGLPARTPGSLSDPVQRNRRTAKPRPDFRRGDVGDIPLYTTNAVQPPPSTSRCGIDGFRPFCIRSALEDFPV